MVLLLRAPEAGLQSPVEPTRLFMDSLNGSGARVLRMVPLGFPNPTRTLPKIGRGGETMQVIGMKRDPQDRWHGGHGVFLDDGFGSNPDDPDAKTIEPDRTAQVPSESGNFITAPRIEFELRIRGEAFTCATDGDNDQEVFTAPAGGKFPQVGADILRQHTYWLRPRREGTTGTKHDASGDLCGVVQLIESRIAGEGDMVLYQGRLMNGAWKADQPMTETNDWVDGRFVLEHLRATLPAGWRFEVTHRHPYQSSVTPQVESLLEYPARDQDVREGEDPDFWFVAVRESASAGAQARARHYFECRHEVWASGGLTSTRVPYYDDTGQLTLDYGRIGVNDQGVTGWTAIRQVEEEVRTGVGGIQPFWSQWEQGNSGAGFRGRVGWLQACNNPNGNDGGGDQVYGAAAVRPWHTWWYRQRMVMAGAVPRHRRACRDVTTWQAPWLWEVATLEGGEWKNPAQANMGFAWAGNLMPHFIGPLSEVPNGALRSDGNNPSVEPTIQRFRLSPRDRGWHESLPGREDPTAAERATYVPFDAAHQSRLRHALIDNWMGRRDPLAYYRWEECAALNTRMHSTLQATNVINQNDVANANLAFIESMRLPDESDRGQGFWRYSNSGTASSRWRSSENHRGWGWSGLLLVGFYSIATDEMRANFRGEGLAGQRGCGNLLEAYVDHFDYITSPAGMPFAMKSSASTPWSEAAWGPTNVPARTGAYPWDNPGAPGIFGTVSKWFFAVFNTMAIDAMLRWGVGDDYPIGPNLLEHLRWSDHHQAGSIAKGVQTNQMTNEHVLVNVGPIRWPDTDAGPFGTPFTVQEVRSGANAWPLINGSDGNRDASYRSQHSKQGAMTQIAVRRFGSDYLRLTRNIEIGQQGATLDELLDWLVVTKGLDPGDYGLGLEKSLFDRASNDRRRQGVGEHTWNVPLIAQVLNLRDDAAAAA